jgi:hypothetical protein
MVSYITKQDGLQECLDGTQMSGNICTARELDSSCPQSDHIQIRHKPAATSPSLAPQPGAIKEPKSKIKNQNSKTQNQ